MASIVSLLIPIVVAVIAALIALAINERFAPDALLKQIVAYVIYALVLIFVILKLVPLIH